MKQMIRIADGSHSFLEDKDAAKNLRVTQIVPTLNGGHDVVLDFKGVDYATQSYIHALIGEPLKRYGPDVLERFEFKNCSAQIQSLIGLVVDYSLGGFGDIDDRSPAKT